MEEHRCIAKTLLKQAKLGFESEKKIQAGTTIAKRFVQSVVEKFLRGEKKLDSEAQTRSNAHQDGYLRDWATEQVEEDNPHGSCGGKVPGLNIRPECGFAGRMTCLAPLHHYMNGSCKKSSSFTLMNLYTLTCVF